jgi:hypothetical protein
MSMRQIRFALIPLLLLYASSAADAADSKPLAAIKRLAGTWQGKAKMGDAMVPVSIVYEPTAGGSAVLERLFPGTPHEMLSVYTADGDGVTLTHYCALGNHPKMTLRKADTNTLTFELSGSEGLHSPSEMHMHAVTIAWTDDDHLRETWTSYDKGQPKEQKVFELARKR